MDFSEKMEIAIGYDTTIKNNGTVEDAFNELRDDINGARGNPRITIRRVNYPVNMPASMLDALKALVPDVPFVPGTFMKLFQDGSETHIHKQTIKIQGGPSISMLDLD